MRLVPAGRTTAPSQASGDVARATVASPTTCWVARFTLRYSLFAARLRALRHAPRGRSPLRILGRSSPAHPCVLVVPRMRTRATADPSGGPSTAGARRKLRSGDSLRFQLAPNPRLPTAAPPYTSRLRPRPNTARLVAQVASADDGFVAETAALRASLLRSPEPVVKALPAALAAGSLLRVLLPQSS